MSKSNEPISFLAGGILGAAIGAVIGLLFAPTSGEKVRKKLKKQTIDIANEVNENLKKVDLSAIKPHIETAKKEIGNRIESATEEVKRAVESKIAKKKEVVSE